MIYQGGQQATAQPVLRKEEKKDDGELLKESLKLAVLMADPTGISSWGDLADSWLKANDEGWTVNNTLDVGINLLSSIPVVSAIPLVKGIKGASKAAKVGKMLKGIDKTEDITKAATKAFEKPISKLQNKAYEISKSLDELSSTTPGAVVKALAKAKELEKAKGDVKGILKDWNATRRNQKAANKIDTELGDVEKKIEDLKSKLANAKKPSKKTKLQRKKQDSELQRALSNAEKRQADLIKQRPDVSNIKSTEEFRKSYQEALDLLKQKNEEFSKANELGEAASKELEEKQRVLWKKQQKVDDRLNQVYKRRGEIPINVGNARNAAEDISNVGTDIFLKGLKTQAAAAGLTGVSNYAGQKADQVFGTNIAPYLTLGMGILGTIGGGKMVGSPKLGKYTGNGTDIKIGGVNKKSTAAIDALKKEKAEVQLSRGFLQKLNRWSGKNKKVRELDKKINLEEKMLSNGVFNIDDLKGNKKASLVKDLLREQGVTKNDALSLVDVEGTKFVRIADKKGNVRFMDGDGKTFIASGKGNLWTGRPRAIRQDVPDSLDELIDVTGHYGLVDYTKLLGKDWQSSVANAAMPIGLSGAGIGMMSKQPQQRDLALGDIQGIMFNPNNQVYDANLGGYRRPTMEEATQMYTEQLLLRQSSGERLKPYEQRFLGQGQLLGIQGGQTNNDDMLNALIQIGAQAAQ